MAFRRFLFPIAFLTTCPFALGEDKPVAEIVQVIRKVGKEGAGNAEAAKAGQLLAEAGSSALPPLLNAFTGATPGVKNWLRLTIAQLADREQKAGRKLPVEQLTAFVTASTNDAAARTVAYQLLKGVSPVEAKKLLPTFLDDASVDLRREAIVDQLAAGKSDAGKLKTLFDATRDKDQAEEIAKLLEAMGQPVDLTAHFGYFTTWHLCGPFDSPMGAGFAQSFPAESGFNPAESYPGKGGKSVGWKTVTTSAKYGMVDLNKELGKSMDAVAYAAVQFNCDAEMPCEVRVGSKNAVHIYLNGVKLFEREAYHHGFNMDQHIGTGTLKAGRNQVVLKVVQNNQKENWAQDWAFNLRVCDATGGRLPLTIHVPPMPTPTPEVKK